MILGPDASPYLLLLLVGVLPNNIWRWLAVFLVRGLALDSPVIEWVRYSATALVAGVVAQLLLDPGGALASVPLWGRLGALGLGVGVYFLTRRSVIVGLLAGEAGLVLVGSL